MQLRVATWNMQGGGRQFYAKLSHLLKQIYYINDGFQHFRKIFCLQEMGSYNEFNDLIGGFPQQREIRDDVRELRLLVWETHREPEGYDVASLLMTYRNDCYYLFAAWRDAAVEANARCGVGIMVQVDGEQASLLLKEVNEHNPINAQMANRFFNFAVRPLRAFVDYPVPRNFEPENIRPIIELLITENNQPVYVFSMHATSDNRARDQVLSFVAYLVSYRNNGQPVYCNFIIGGDFNHEPVLRNQQMRMYNVIPYEIPREMFGFEEQHTRVVRTCPSTQGPREGALVHELDYFIVRQYNVAPYAVGWLRRDDGEIVGGVNYIGNLLSDHIIVYTTLNIP